MTWAKAGDIYTLRITLLYCRPACWREVEALNWTNLEELHWLIQYAMPWEDSHLHGFCNFHPYGRQRGAAVEKERRWSGRQREELMGMPMEDEDESQTRMDEVLKKKGDALFYEYDFGDTWLHEIKLMEVRHWDEKQDPYPRCVAGEGMCPPEDCGGVPGWEEMQQVLKNPKHGEYAGIREWLGLKKGEKIDAKAFDLAATDKRMAKLRPKPSKPRKKGK